MTATKYPRSTYVYAAMGDSEGSILLLAMGKEPKEAREETIARARDKAEQFGLADSALFVWESPVPATLLN